MAIPFKLNLKAYQGSTFKEVVRWESSTKVYKSITGITAAAPMVVTAVAHGMLSGWQSELTNVIGMTDVNSLGSINATAVTTDTITFNDVNAVGFKTYISGGILKYNQPRSLAGLTARMQIRGKLTDTAIIVELTTANAGIVLDDTAKTITINITAAATTAYTFKSAVYSLEIIDGAIVTPLIYGSITLDPEVTR